MKKLDSAPKPNITRPRRRLTLALLILIILSSGLAWLYDSQRRVTYVIPAGLDAGQVAMTFPNEIILTVGLKDTLVIENQDDVVHSFGPFVLGPKSTFTKRFSQARVYEGACTFHQNNQMRIVVKPAPWSIIRWPGSSAAE